MACASPAQMVLILQTSYYTYVPESIFYKRNFLSWPHLITLSLALVTFVLQEGIGITIYLVALMTHDDGMHLNWVVVSSPGLLYCHFGRI